MSIRTKLVLAISIPLVALTLFAGSIALNSMESVSEMDRIGRLTAFATTASSLVHETQKERGATAGFLGAKGDDSEFKKRLANQRLLTNEKLDAFQEFMTDFSHTSYGDEFAKQVDKALEQMTSLQEKRGLVDGRSIPAGKAIGYYTALNGMLLDAVGKAALATSDGEVSARICAFNAFLKSKERAGIERAVLANTFARDSFGPGMYEKFTALVALQDSFMHEFINIADQSDLRFYEEKLAAPCVERVATYRAAAVAKAAEGGFGQNPGEWFDTITKKINLLKQVDDHLAEGLTALSNSKADDARASLYLVIGVNAIFAAAVALGGWYVVHSVLNRLRLVTERFHDIASDDADLTQRLDESDDEIGVLCGWINQMLERMRSIIQDIAITSKELASSAEQLVGTSSSLKDGAESSKVQSASISSAAEEMSINMGQTATATEKLSSTIESVSNSLGGIQSSIREISSRSNHSAEVVHTATACVEKGNNQIGQLGEAAKEIGDVINVIQDIAEQTNLLALNATIEAARAGEAGRGFAVVATEVKELAGQTAKATDGIRERVMAMQECTEQTVGSMADIDQVIREVSEIAESIAEEVSQQTHGVADIADNMQQSAESSRVISTGVSDSAIASQEITKSVSVVDTTIRNTANGADDTRAAGANVAQLATKLRRQVEPFKTS